MKSRNTRIAWTGVFAVCAGLGCATTQVSTDRDPTVRLSQYRTFTLKRGQVVDEGVVEKRDTSIRDRIDQVVQAELSEKGLQRTTQNPDLIVTYTAAERTQEELSGSWAATSGLGDVHDSTRYLTTNNFSTTYTRQGVLVIDLIDANTNKLVWRSIARAENKDFGKPENIEKAVDKALEKFPEGA